MAAPHREDVQRVLYVDDDPVSRRIFEQLGKGAQVAVDTCGSLDEAFAFARQHVYSVIAADYSLRRWDGLSVLRELSSLQSQASLMLVTDAERKRELPSSLLRYDFVEKPIRRAEVLAQLNDALLAFEERASTPHAALMCAPILLISSDPTLADQIVCSLAQQGHGRPRITCAAGLAPALAMLKAVSFAAAIVDGTSAPGLEATRQQRETDGGSREPFVADSSVYLLPDVASERKAARDIVEELLVHAPGLPLVLISDEPERLELPSRGRARARAGQVSVMRPRPRFELAGRFPQVAVLRREASAELVVHVLCSAVERAERERAIAELSHNDLTTGARNRPTFCALLARQVEQRLPFVLACLAVEGLGEINQSLGHIRGDAVLAASVSRMTRELGPRSVVGRIGGSVFGVLCESLGPDSADGIARVVRQLFELPFDLSDSQVRVAVQVAAVEYPRDGVLPEELLQEAERALREQKAQGLRRRTAPPPSMAQS